MSRGIALIALMCVIAVGCASPPSRFYTLSASPPDLNAKTAKLAVVVGPGDGLMLLAPVFGSRGIQRGLLALATFFVAWGISARKR